MARVAATVKKRNENGTCLAKCCIKSNLQDNHDDSELQANQTNLAKQMPNLSASITAIANIVIAGLLGQGALFWYHPSLI
eukprot:4448984-Amphidinium_carterae.2